LKERKYTLFFIVNNSNYKVNSIITNLLVEYHPLIEKQTDSIMGGMRNLLNQKLLTSLIIINVEKCFIIVTIYNNKIDIMYQSDSEDDCQRVIEKDIEHLTNNCYYYIIHTKSLVFTENYAGKATYQTMYYTEGHIRVI